MMANRSFFSSAHRYGTSPRPIGAGGSPRGPLRGVSNPVNSIRSPVGAAPSPMQDLARPPTCIKCGATILIATGGCNCTPGTPPGPPQFTPAPSTTTTPALPGNYLPPPTGVQQPSTPPAVQQQQPPQLQPAQPQQPPQRSTFVPPAHTTPSFGPPSIPQQQRPGIASTGAAGEFGSMQLGAGRAWADAKNWWEKLPRWKKWLYGGLAVAVPVTGIGVVVAASGSHDGAHEDADDDDDRVYVRDELGRFV